LGKAAPRSADERQVSEQVATGEGMEPEAADENVEDSSGDTEPEE
jgi:hypothetical protein